MTSAQEERSLLLAEIEAGPEGPEIGAFFSAKRRYDPDGLFTNTFYRKYAS